MTDRANVMYIREDFVGVENIVSALLKECAEQKVQFKYM